MRTSVLVYLLLVGSSLFSCGKVDLINLYSPKNGDEMKDGKKDLFAISSSSSEKVKLESYFSFDSENKTCSDGSPYTDYSANIINIYGSYNSETNNMTFSTDTASKVILKGMSPCAEEPWISDTSAYSLYDPKPLTYYLNSGNNDYFKIEFIEIANQQFFINNPESLVRLREIFSIAKEGIATDYFYLGQYTNQTIQGGIFRFLSDYYLGYNTMQDLLINTKNQYGFNSLRDKAFSKGYSHKLDPYPYDPSYPLDIMSVVKYYSEAAERNLY